MGLLDDHVDAGETEEERRNRWRAWRQQYEIDFKPSSWDNGGLSGTTMALYPVEGVLGEDSLGALRDLLSRFPAEAGEHGYAVQTPDGYETLVVPRLDRGSSASGFKRKVLALRRNAEPVRYLRLSIRVDYDLTESWTIVIHEEGGCSIVHVLDLVSFPNWRPEPSQVRKGDALLLAKAAVQYLGSQ